MSRKQMDVSRLRRMKRLAGRHGLTILTADKLRTLGQPGGHAIRDENFQVIYGNEPRPFSASLDDIEAYLEALVAGEE